MKVESPVDCRIYIRYKTKEEVTTANGGVGYVDRERISELLLTQVFNYRFTDSKRPVYGFNRKQFDQIVNGKQLLEGVIVLKKSMLNDLGSLLVNSADLSSYSNNATEEKIEYLYNQFVDDPAMKSMVNLYEKEVTKDTQNKIESYIKESKYDIFNNLPSGVKLVIAFGSAIKSIDFQNRMKAIYDLDSGDTLGDMERLIMEQSDMVFTDINFTEKSGEINVGKNDIDEVYKFFANVKGGI